MYNIYLFINSLVIINTTKQISKFETKIFLKRGFLKKLALLDKVIKLN